MMPQWLTILFWLLVYGGAFGALLYGAAIILRWIDETTKATHE